MALYKYRQRDRWYQSDASRPVGVFAQELVSNNGPRDPHDTLLSAKMIGRISISAGAAVAPPPNLVYQLTFSLMITFSYDASPFIPSESSDDQRLLAVQQLRPRVLPYPPDPTRWTMMFDHDGIIQTKGMRKGNGSAGGPIVSAVLFIDDRASVIDPAFGYNISYDSFGELSTWWGSTLP